MWQPSSNDLHCCQRHCPDACSAARGAVCAARERGERALESWRHAAGPAGPGARPRGMGPQRAGRGALAVARLVYSLVRGREPSQQPPRSPRPHGHARLAARGLARRASAVGAPGFWVSYKKAGFIF